MHLTKREEYEARAEKMLEPLMEENGFELVDVEYVKEAVKPVSGICVLMWTKRVVLPLMTANW